MSSAAAEAVAGTGELLELILLSMDMQTLLGTASRVCRQWQHIIQTTPSIQRAFFFDPEEAIEGMTDDVPHKRLNPLLHNPDPSCFENPKVFLPPQPPGISDINFWPVTGKMGYMRLHELALDKANLEAVDNPMVRDCASWRKMYISQPPCRTVAVISHRGQGQAPLAPCARSSLSPMSGVFEYENGMQMGDLYDLTVTHCENYPVDGFLIVSLGGIMR